MGRTLSAHLTLLNSDNPSDLPHSHEAPEDLDINVEPPSKEEIVAAIKELKNQKAAKCRVIQNRPRTSIQSSFTLICHNMGEKTIPEDWCKGRIVKIPKKGDLTNCNNWRCITLLSVPSNIFCFCKIIVKRLSAAVDKVLRKEQAGFRKGRGCTDHIFTVRSITEQCPEWQRELCIHFMDLKKDFENIHRDSLWRILWTYGIPPHIVDLIKLFYENYTCSMGQSDIAFKVKSGVRQGCVMSAVLLNIAIDWVMKKTMEGSTRGIRWTLFSSLEDIDFADDVALLSHTRHDLQEKTSKLNDISQKLGIKITQKKSKVIRINQRSQVAIYIGHESYKPRTH